MGVAAPLGCSPLITLFPAAGQRQRDQQACLADHEGDLSDVEDILPVFSWLTCRTACVNRRSAPTAKPSASSDGSMTLSRRTELIRKPCPIPPLRNPWFRYCGFLLAVCDEYSCCCGHCCLQIMATLSTDDPAHLKLFNFLGADRSPSVGTRRLNFACLGQGNFTSFSSSCSTTWCGVLQPRRRYPTRPNGTTGSDRNTFVAVR